MSGFQRLKRYALDGFFILLPIALLIFLVTEIFDALEMGADVLAQFVPRTTLFGIDISHWIALGLLVLIAVVLGALSATEFGKKVGEWIDNKLLSRIPAYSILRDLSKRFSGFSTDTRFSPAVVEMPMSTRVLAFIVEEIDNGDYVVLIPTAPTPMVGQIQHVARSRVTPLDVSMAKAINCITSWGLGAGSLFNINKAEHV